MEVVDSSDEDEVGGTAAAGGGAGPPDGTVLLFTIRPCNKKKMVKTFLQPQNICI